MNKISKIIGTGLLAGVMLTGCLKNAAPNESKLEKIINPVNVEKVISDEGRRYPSALEEKITSLDSYEGQIHNEDEIVLDDEINYLEKNFNLYEELSKKNTSIQFAKESHPSHPENTIMGYDIIQNNGKDYLVSFVKSIFYNKENGKPSELTVIDGKWEINKDEYEINDKNEHIFRISPPGYNGYVIFIENGDNSIIYDGFYDTVWKSSFQKNSPIKNNDKDILAIFEEDEQPHIEHNGKEYEIPFYGYVISAGGTAPYQGR